MLAYVQVHKHRDKEQRRNNISNLRKNITISIDFLYKQINVTQFGITYRIKQIHSENFECKRINEETNKT